MRRSPVVVPALLLALLAPVQSEFRQTWESTLDGRPVRARDFPGLQILMTLLMGPKRYEDISVPALASRCSNRIAGSVVAIRYGIFRYVSGTVNSQSFNWRAHVPRLSLVTRTTSIGMISGTSCLKCTLSMMRWTDT
jgi:hypothetical protein